MDINKITSIIKQKTDSYYRDNMVTVKPKVKFEVYDADEQYFELDLSLWNNGYINSDGINVPDDDWKSTIGTFEVPKTSFIYYNGSLIGSNGGIWVNNVLTGEEQFFTANTQENISELSFQLEQGSYFIAFSYYLPGVNAKPFSMTIAQFERVDISRFISNVTNLEVMMDRKDLSGIKTEVSFPITFEKEGRSLIKYLWDSYGIYAKTGFSIYKKNRKGFILNEYELLKDFKLVFTSYKERHTTVEIESYDASVQGLVNAYEKTKYDIPVSDIADAKKFNYERITLPSTANFTASEATSIEFIGSRYLFYIDFNNIELAPDGAQHRGQTQQAGFLTNDVKDSMCFFVAASEVTVTLSFGMRVSISKNKQVKELQIWKFIPAVLDPDTEEEITPATTSYIFTKDLDQYDSVTDEWYTELYNENMQIELNKGEGLLIGVNTSIGDNEITLRLSNTQPLRVQWYDKGQPLVIDVINPKKLLQAYIDKMSGQVGKYMGDIYWKEQDYSLMLCAAESIRGFNGAKVHGSLKDFSDWMRAFGYEKGFDGNTLFFQPRDKFYDRNIVAVELKKKELADLIKVVDSEHIYSSVKVGYGKIDYSQAGGRYEFNSEYEYTTGYDVGSLETAKTLDLISPYRADSMGIEFLSWERLKETTDDKSDADIFVIALTENSTNYTVYEGYQATVGGIKLFNGVINPRNLIMENESLIGITSTKLTFASTAGADSFTIEGIPYIFSSIDINKKLFEPMIYDFASGNFVNLPDKDKEAGLIRFPYKGNWYQGFIKEIRKNYNRETETTWILYAVKS